MTIKVLLKALEKRVIMVPEPLLGVLIPQQGVDQSLGSFDGPVLGDPLTHVLCDHHSMGYAPPVHHVARFHPVSGIRQLV
jgi:hypothetical protein